MRSYAVIAAGALLVVTGPGAGQERKAAAPFSATIEISPAKHDRANEPVRVGLTLPEEHAGVEKVVITRRGAGKEMVLALGQLTAPGLGRPAAKVPRGKVARDLHFVLPELRSGQSLEARVLIDPALKIGAGGQFVWKPAAGGEARLCFREGKSDRPVLSYQHAALDESSEEARVKTFKVFHHVYSPDGDALLTKGAGGQFTHHRGLFYGFMKASYDKNTVDIWHCPSPADKRKAKQEAHQAHKGTRSQEAGRVLGRHTVEVAWNGVGKKTFATELREVTAYNVPGGTLIEFASLLTPTGGEVRLDGDPQHAGFHFRASNEVAEKTKGQTVFIRPGGDGKPGTEVNWSSKNNKVHVNLPWLAMSFVVGGKRYTAAYLDHPANPKEARFSERTYGRFGSYFVTTVTKEKPLLVRYRVWVQEGQMTGAQVKAKSAAFVTPVEVRVK